MVRNPKPISTGFDRPRGLLTEPDETFLERLAEYHGGRLERPTESRAVIAFDGAGDGG